MTSGTFERVFLSSIIINRETRQRRELPRIAELAASIEKIGLIHPPTITRELVLVAGERRLEACRSLGWLEIPVQYSDTLELRELQLIELEENVKRVDISWQEQNDAIAVYHSLRESMSKGWSIAATADELGVSNTWISKNLIVAKARAEAIEGVGACDQFSTALGISQRAFDRRKTETLRDLPSVVTFAAPAALAAAPEIAAPAPAPASRMELLHTSFLSWVDAPTARFNLVHCDFPYGVNVGDKQGQSAAKLTGTYEDTPEVYFALLSALVENQDAFIEPSAHLLFWFSMNFYEETRSVLSGAGWSVNPFPLIWFKSDNAGILPDKDRGPRRVYETALLCSRGDRKIVRPVSNVFAGPTARSHTSEKPRPMLDHFFRMLVDSSTTLLDPTAGSANALACAENAGAEYALGLELNQQFYEDAKERLGL